MCHNTGGSFFCSCEEGFQLGTGGKICTDINECSDGLQCDQVCRNEAGRFYCECLEGFLLDEADGSTCHGQ